MCVCGGERNHATTHDRSREPSLSQNIGLFSLSPLLYVAAIPPLSAVMISDRRCYVPLQYWSGAPRLFHCRQRVAPGASVCSPLSTFLRQFFETNEYFPRRHFSIDLQSRAHHGYHNTLALTSDRAAHVATDAEGRCLSGWTTSPGTRIQPISAQRMGGPSKGSDTERLFKVGEGIDTLEEMCMSASSSISRVDEFVT